MATEQDMLSPPLSGRAHKSQEPRIAAAGVIAAHGALNAVCQRKESSLHRGMSAGVHHLGYAPEFANGAGDRSAAAVAIGSPGKKRGSSMSKAEDRMLTPPLSRDTRMDGGRTGSTPGSRSLSDGELDVHVASTSYRPTARGDHGADASLESAQVRSRKRQRGPVASAESDDEENPFMARPRPSSSSSSSSRHQLAQTRSSYVEPDFVSDDEEMRGAGENESDDGETTPRPATRARLALPTGDHVRVDSQDVSALRPIRDTPMNPFLEGGPADSGLEGPRAGQARARAQAFPGKERGKITYVFRGQRVVYADPEYDSDDSDEAYQRTGQRPPRLQPKLLFPAASSSSSSRPAPSASTQAGPSKPRGGLFAAEIAARESAKRKAQGPPGWPSEASARLQAMTGSSIEREREAEVTRHAQERPHGHGAHAGLLPPASTWNTGPRSQHPTGEGSTSKSASADDRSALLARLEEAGWSEEDGEGEVDEHYADNVAVGASTAAGQHEAVLMDADLTGGAERASKRPRFEAHPHGHQRYEAQGATSSYGDGRAHASAADHTAATATAATTADRRGPGLMAAFQEARGGMANGGSGGVGAPVHGRGLAQRMRRR
ncbi:uncharacterized protein PFL1_01175 [Pseudozyma flocculosa PF-1]|uniref:Uncharacterized protein n=1 Tax=Pseudozyma flocculosa TaxID=84751 RepID=A0A5C3ETZ0_9BASI|nr:uncharacterized protein PFL1_01175 [Pseudozyma flocculosa PF-1]EPQ30986.1 hypothetical protein PFL1_01175 [Pseudozyma flocculosa PF-1]SPO35824.1 uncharacterized protein PSFLO_01295 [Pseudozyma flocculosa]